MPLDGQVIAVPHVTPSGGQCLSLATGSPVAPSPHVSLRLVGGTVTGQIAWRRAAVATDLWVGALALPPRELDVRAVTAGGVTSPVHVRVRPLPQDVPLESDAEPLRVILSSCFYRKNDEGHLGDAVMALRSKLAPHLKILCGDQVYLDMPVSEDLPRDQGKLRERLLRKYLTNWTDGAVGPPFGFASFLGWGSNIFVSDDHEFWNNYPFQTVIASNTLTEKGRRKWAEVARELYLAFQTSTGHPATPQPTCFRIGRTRRISLFALDGRFSRTKDLAYAPDHLDAVLDWIARLDCPGLLVLSQPLFEEPHGFFGRRFVDASLQDYDDHRALERALMHARHDVVVLSGDIHGGRVAVAETGSARIHEVIASPSALVALNPYHDAPAYAEFPTTPSNGLATVGVRSTAPVLCDHFALLSICAGQNSLHVEVEHWSLGPAPKVRASFSIRNLQ